VIAALTGDYDAAKTYWNSITAQTRPSAAKLSARQYLKQLEDTPDDEAAQ
jgi:hypothetical protein